MPSANRLVPGNSNWAKRFWNAFTAPTPEPLQRLLKSGLRLLPEIRPTVDELLQEYPGAHDGLSRLERKLLHEIDGLGVATAAFVVGSVIRREWVGDLLLYDMLRRFVAARSPLLTFAGPFTEKFESYEFSGAKLTLTAFGGRVLAGKADHVATNGIDRWIGGVHLNGTRVSAGDGVNGNIESFLRGPDQSPTLVPVRAPCVHSRCCRC